LRPWRLASCIGDGPCFSPAWSVSNLSGWGVVPVFVELWPWHHKPIARRRNYGRLKAYKNTRDHLEGADVLSPGRLGLDLVATCGYMFGVMKTVSIREAKNRLLQLAREVERGETIVVTRNGRPVIDLVPHQPAKGLRLEAIAEFKQKHGIKTIVPYIADDFDDPLPEDFLLRPLPSET
jgi:prevent-host-death family protein